MIANIETSSNKKFKKSYFFNEYNNSSNNFDSSNLIVPNFIGNISDSEWNKLIVTETGRPARTAQDLFAEIVSWYKLNKRGQRKIKGNIWGTSYSYLTKKLSIQREAIRKNILKLEYLELIKRIIAPSIVHGQVQQNVLHLALTEKAFGLLQAQNINNDASTLKNKVSPTKVEDINNTNNNYKINRSTKSNFCKKNLSNATESLIVNTDTSKISENTLLKAPKKTLADFSELTDEDYDILRKLSGRDFSSDGIKKILRALISKCRNVVFYAKQGFLKYFAKCLHFELRSEEQVNDANFRCLVKPTKEEQIRKQQEKYLDEVETSTAEDMEQSFKKQVARNFTSDRAYQILTSLRGFTTDGHKVVLQMDRKLCFELAEREKLVKIADSVHAEYYMREHKIGIGELIGNALANYHSDDEREQLIPELTELVIDVKESKPNTNTLVKSGSNSNDTAKTLTNSEEHLQLFNKFADWFDEATARSWFSSSKFEVSCDHQQKTIVAKARTSFIFYYFKDHYKRYLETITKQLFTGYEFILQGVVA